MEIKSLVFTYNEHENRIFTENNLISFPRKQKKLPDSYLISKIKVRFDFSLCRQKIRTDEGFINLPLIDIEFKVYPVMSFRNLENPLFK